MRRTQLWLDPTCRDRHTAPEIHRHSRTRQNTGRQARRRLGAQTNGGRGREGVRVRGRVRTTSTACRCCSGASAAVSKHGIFCRRCKTVAAAGCVLMLIMMMLHLLLLCHACSAPGAQSQERSGESRDTVSQPRQRVPTPVRLRPLHTHTHHTQI